MEIQDMVWREKQSSSVGLLGNDINLRVNFVWFYPFLKSKKRLQ